MDLLSDALDIVRLTGAVVFRVEVTGPWCATASPSLDKLKATLPASTNHIVAFHVVLDGECQARCASSDWMSAGEGEVVVLPYGDVHDLGDHEDDNPVDLDLLLDGKPLTDLRELKFETGAKPHTEFLCGFLGCDRRAFSPLFASLPRMFVTPIRDSAVGLTQYALSEALSEAPGSASLRVRMAELLFLETLRGFIRELPEHASGWLAALRDPTISQALHLMHESPAAEWTVEAIADKVACSRSNLADRFKTIVGQTPMAYLTNLRMQHAARLISDTRCSVAAVADEVGYTSAAAFQRAFKRCFGLPPASWRRANRRDANEYRR